jgi:hypothetical protein
MVHGIVWTIVNIPVLPHLTPSPGTECRCKIQFYVGIIAHAVSIMPDQRIMFFQVTMWLQFHGSYQIIAHVNTKAVLSFFKIYFGDGLKSFNKYY